MKCIGAKKKSILISHHVVPLHFTSPSHLSLAVVIMGINKDIHIAIIGAGEYAATHYLSLI